jgi:hypothetical protein
VLSGAARPQLGCAAGASWPLLRATALPQHPLTAPTTKKALTLSAATQRGLAATAIWGRRGARVARRAGHTRLQL